MAGDIILIGPIRSGKSTQGKLLSEALGWPQVSADALRDRYYEELGFSRLSPEERAGPDGMFASRFNVHLVERILEDHRGVVFDLGAGHSVYRDEESLERVARALEPYPNVVLLLPSPDLERSSEVLRARNLENDWLNGFRQERGYDPNEHFLRHPSNRRLAKTVVYTEGDAPEETCECILRQALLTP